MSERSILNVLREQFSQAIAAVSGRPAGEIDPLVKSSGDPKFGDYQCNAAMGLAKTLGAKAREVAERIAAAAGPLLAEIAEPLEIAGPGFLNIRLKRAYLEGRLGAIEPAPSDAGADRFGIAPIAHPETVIVDYSSPNIAKQMHVGHLRSTIIGDSLVRVLGFAGHRVTRQNHVGDWGTQFGMLIAWYANHPFPSASEHDVVLAALEDDYRAANERFKNDAEFATNARLAVGRLQSGDAGALEVWKRVCAASSAAFNELYARLGILLRDADVCGESFYNPMLPGVIDALRHDLPPRDPATQKNPWAEFRVDNGAACVFLYGPGGDSLYKNPEGAPFPLIVQKSDGAFLYATTDLAAIRYRAGRGPNQLGAKRVLYVVGAPIKLHLEMVFRCARLAGWVGEDVRLEHVSFGQVLGEDRKLLRTRSGGAVKLRELLDEAERRAGEMLEAKLAEEPPGERPEFSTAEKDELVRRIGVGAVKYFDLARELNGDYVFNYDQMLALQGNTAPYMLYAYARIRSIHRKATERLAVSAGEAERAPLQLEHPAERALALRLLRLGEAIEVVAADLTPHVLCGYAYELAGEFMRFYEACPVIQAPEPAVQLSRLRLTGLTARALRIALGLVGIEVAERM